MRSLPLGLKVDLQTLEKSKVDRETSGKRNYITSEARRKAAVCQRNGLLKVGTTGCAETLPKLPRAGLFVFNLLSNHARNRIAVKIKRCRGTQKEKTCWANRSSSC